MIDTEKTHIALRVILLNQDTILSLLRTSMICHDHPWDAELLDKTQELIEVTRAMLSDEALQESNDE